MTVGENIRKLRKQAGLTQIELAQRLGVSNTTVSEWERDQFEPRMGPVQRMAGVFDVSMRAIMEPGDEVREDLAVYRPTPARSTAPLYGSISAGAPREAIEAEGQVHVPDPLIAAHPNGFFLRVSGECMNRVLPDGSYAFIDPDAEVPSGKIAAVIVNGHEATIKRYHRGANSVVLSPDSYDASYTDQVYDFTKEDTEEVRLIGRVVWFSAPYDQPL